MLPFSRFFSVASILRLPETARSPILSPCDRGVAQLGSASALGAEGRWFESSRPDHARGCGSMVEPQPSKLMTRVRFPSPAPCSFKPGLAPGFSVNRGQVFPLRENGTGLSSPALCRRRLRRPADARPSCRWPVPNSLREKTCPLLPSHGAGKLRASHRLVTPVRQKLTPIRHISILIPELW